MSTPTFIIIIIIIFHKKSRKHLKKKKNLSYTCYKKQILNKSPTTKRYLNKIYFS